MIDLHLVYRLLTTTSPAAASSSELLQWGIVATHPAHGEELETNSAQHCEIPSRTAPLGIVDLTPGIANEEA